MSECQESQDGIHAEVRNCSIYRELLVSPSRYNTSSICKICIIVYYHHNYWRYVTLVVVLTCTVVSGVIIVVGVCNRSQIWEPLNVHV